MLGCLSRFSSLHFTARRFPLFSALNFACLPVFALNRPLLAHSITLASLLFLISCAVEEDDDDDGSTDDDEEDDDRDGNEDSGRHDDDDDVDGGPQAEDESLVTSSTNSDAKPFKAFKRITINFDTRNSEGDNSKRIAESEEEGMERNMR